MTMRKQVTGAGTSAVIPAQAGIQYGPTNTLGIPACAGMTEGFVGASP